MRLKNDYLNKGVGREMHLKCWSCGQDTRLPIHQNCGDKGNEKRIHNFTERECESVDCKNVYKPTASRQKLCPDCIKLKKQAIYNR